MDHDRVPEVLVPAGCVRRVHRIRPVAGPHEPVRARRVPDGALDPGAPLVPHLVDAAFIQDRGGIDPVGLPSGPGTEHRVGGRLDPVRGGRRDEELAAGYRRIEVQLASPEVGLACPNGGGRGGPDRNHGNDRNRQCDRGRECAGGGWS